jgi:hypothetical protein
MCVAQICSPLRTITACVSEDGCCARGCTTADGPRLDRDCATVLTEVSSTVQPVGTPGPIAAADLNGDAIRDSLVADGGSESLVACQGDGTGSCAPRPPTAARVIARGSGAGTLGIVADLAAADVTGDGKIDAVTAVVGKPPNNDVLSTSIGNGAFGFAAGPRSRLAGAPVRLQLVELNADAKLDAAVATSAGLELLRNRGDGSFERIALLDADSSVADVAIGPAIANGQFGIVAALPASNQMKVYRVDGESVIEAAAVDVDDPRAVVAGDFTGDGIEDLAVASGAGFIAVYPGRTDGGFAAAIGDRVTGLIAKRLVRTDLNANGLADLVVLERDTATVRLLLGHGDGTFEAQEGATTNGPSAGLAVADLNNDRLPDFVLSGGELVMGITHLNSPPIVAGDATGDGAFDQEDIDRLIAEIFDGDGADALSSGNPPIACAAGADANLDDTITAADLIRGTRATSVAR